MSQHTPSLQEIASCVSGYDPRALPVAQAQEFISRLVPRVQASEVLAIRSALGRVLARDLVSTMDADSDLMCVDLLHCVDDHFEHDDSWKDSDARWRDSWWTEGADSIATIEMFEHRFNPFPTMSRILHGVMPKLGTDWIVIGCHDGLDKCGDIII